MTSDQKKSQFPFLFGLFFIAIALFSWQGWSWWQRAIAPVATTKTTPNQTNTPVQFNVPPGTTGQEIGHKLAEAGLIRSLDAWKLWVWWQQKQEPSGGFKAGTYLLSSQDSLSTIATKIWRGELMQTTFTIPEGWSIQEMAEYFESVGYFSAEDFIIAAREIPYDRYPWLPENIPHLEGFLYPDTYKLSSDRINNPQGIIQIMLNQFEKIALPVYQQTETNWSLREWVTLASIVEKEAVIPDERTLIAGVFSKRLEKEMRLESDPTVEYGLGIKQTADRPLTYGQVGTPSPYNTYLNSGLPPTAIASPGIASLKATLNPAATEYLFFVARYDGTHVFSKTLAEHEAATKAIRHARQRE
jgi:UPF0755 protein